MNCTGKRCLAQYNKVDPATCTAVPYCPQATPPKTNADRIRSMTDEELAKYLAWLVDDEFPPCCEWEMYGDTIQINAWLEWLEDEVKT